MVAAGPGRRWYAAVAGIAACVSVAVAYADATLRWTALGIGAGLILVALTGRHESSWLLRRRWPAAVLPAAVLLVGTGNAAARPLVAT